MLQAARAKSCVRLLSGLPCRYSAQTLIQKPELEMRALSSPFRLMDVQHNGDEGITHSPLCAETGEGTAVVELQLLVGILHQSEQLSFAKQEFLSPGCT